MKENIRVLYLQGFHVFGENRKQKLLENAMGKKNVFVPQIKYGYDLLAFILFIVLVVAIMAFNIVVAFQFAGCIIIAVSVVLSVVIVLSMYFIGSNLILCHIMKKAIKQTETALVSFDPDVIVATYFGGVVAMNLKYRNGLKPLVLISPSVRTFQKFTCATEPDLSEFPYVLLVNGSKDRVTSLGDCEHIVASIPQGRGKLYVVEDNHCYSKLREADLKSWIKEANFNASKCLISLSNKLRYEKIGKKFPMYSRNLTISQSADLINEGSTRHEEEESLV